MLCCKVQNIQIRRLHQKQTLNFKDGNVYQCMSSYDFMPHVGNSKIIFVNTGAQTEHILKTDPQIVVGKMGK